jgi:hypothetical protein
MRGYGGLTWGPSREQTTLVQEMFLMLLEIHEIDLVEARVLACTEIRGETSAASEASEAMLNQYVSSQGFGSAAAAQHSWRKGNWLLR